LSPSEQKILELCGKVTSLQNDSDELKLAIEELKAAIHQHVDKAKDKMADIAFMIKRANAAD
jgi:uncharacterized protein YjbJ (UPF0337 family)